MPPFRPALLAPRQWPVWIGIGLIWLIARIPYKVLLGVGRVAGWVAARLIGPDRRGTARRNLELCFPDLTDAERARLLEENLRDSGIMLIEFALAWMGSPRTLAKIPVTIEGMEHLEAARAVKRGVLGGGAHFSHAELCGRFVSERLRFAGMYREHENAAFEWAIRRARLNYATAMFTKEELRQLVRWLKAGGALWYAPDQDMRGKDIVFAPFFGVPAATITATHHLARLSGAIVVPFFHRRLENGGYAIRLEQPLPDFPSVDAVADTARINSCIERMVREAPTQYLWMHKRFKTRPPGEASVY